MLTFPPNAIDETFSVPILSNPNRSSSFSTVNLTLSQPVGGATLGPISLATLIITNESTPSTRHTLWSTRTTPVRAVCERRSPRPTRTPVPVRYNIAFDIPASTAPNLNVPVSGFDPVTQTWTITLDSPLPPITHSVAIDGYTQANLPVSYRYPDQISSAVQMLSILGGPIGGTFTLTTSAPLPVGTTPPIPYNATAAQVQEALESLLDGSGFLVTLGPVNSTAGVIITFQGPYAAEPIPNLIVNGNLTGGTDTNSDVMTTIVGGVPLSIPTLISSVPNTVTTPGGNGAQAGNNAQVRVIIDGSQIPSGVADIGFVINASDSILRGLAIEGFNVGVSVPNPTNVGDLIQGNFIGEYLAYPVDPATGVALPAPNTVELAGQGNTQQGVVLGSTERDRGGNRSPGQQRHRRQWDARRLDRAGRLGQPGAGEPDRRGRTIVKRLLLPGRQRRGRGADRVVGNRLQSSEHRLCIEQHHRRSGRGSGQSHLGQPIATASTSRAWGRPGTWSRPTTSAWHPAAGTSSATASPATSLMAYGSTTRPITRSADQHRATAT